MDIKPGSKTIRNIFNSNKKIIVPRFQREYSWDRIHYKEFLDDMIKCLVVGNGNVQNAPYFLGTMVFVGSFTDISDDTLSVVDGQQRITTITIMFSALAEVFKEHNQDNLAKQLFKYIMGEDDDGEPYKIITSRSSFPFFAYYIQQYDKCNTPEITTEEEQCIADSYNFFHKSLNKDYISNILINKKGYDADILSDIDELDLLKALRDQVLDTVFVSIETQEKEQAYSLFEVLNAKGKSLAALDLIKNKIFSELIQIEPVDYAQDKWNSIRDILHSRNNTEEFGTFYRHYWLSKYKKSSKKNLYDDFVSASLDYREFLEDMYDSAVLYNHILNPDIADYGNKQGYRRLVQSLRTFNDFNVQSVRVVLLALLSVREKELITSRQLRKVVKFLEYFQFMYTMVLSGKSNRFETKYCKFAIQLRTCKNSNEVNEVIRDCLYYPLVELFPLLDEFKNKFVTMEYTKGTNISNIKTRYALRALYCFFSETDTYPEDATIEHIVSEREGGLALDIGNLILLEKHLNVEADSLDYCDKLTVYKKSAYPWMKMFVDSHSEWNQTSIESRAESLAEVFYNNIFKNAAEVLR